VTCPETLGVRCRPGRRDDVHVSHLLVERDGDGSLRRVARNAAGGVDDDPNLARFSGALDDHSERENVVRQS
jgi:hypothetical protein